MKQFSKKFLKNLLTTRFIFTVLGLGMIGFSAYYNILYFTADMPTAQDWYGAFAGAALADMLKAAMAMALPVLWAGRKYGFLALALLVFAGTTGLSLFAAHEVKLKQQLQVSALKIKVQENRDRITGRYLKAVAAMEAFEGVAPVAVIKSRLQIAEAKISKTRVWHSSGQCMNATVEKSLNVCKQVLVLRTGLEHAQRRALAVQELALATQVVSELSPLVETGASAQNQKIVALVFALMLEIGSSLLLPLARLDFVKILAVHSRRSRPNSPKDKDQPEEVEWLHAMKQAAIDQNHAKIVFNDDGLLKAPYGALAQVWGIKSASTAGQRLQRLKALGYLEVTGSQRNMRYRLLEAI